MFAPRLLVYSAVYWSDVVFLVLCTALLTVTPAACLQSLSVSGYSGVVYVCLHSLLGKSHLSISTTPMTCKLGIADVPSAYNLFVEELSINTDTCGKFHRLSHVLEESSYLTQYFCDPAMLSGSANLCILGCLRI